MFHLVSFVYFAIYSVNRFKFNFLIREVAMKRQEEWTAIFEDDANPSFR